MEWCHYFYEQPVACWTLSPLGEPKMHQMWPAQIELTVFSIWSPKPSSSHVLLSFWWMISRSLQTSWTCPSVFTPIAYPSPSPCIYLLNVSLYPFIPTSPAHTLVWATITSQLEVHCTSSSVGPSCFKFQIHGSQVPIWSGAVHFSLHSFPSLWHLNVTPFLALTMSSGIFTCCSLYLEQSCLCSLSLHH